MQKASFSIVTYQFDKVGNTQKAILFVKRNVISMTLNVLIYMEIRNKQKCLRTPMNC